MNSIDDIIKFFKLEPYIEGGFGKGDYYSDRILPRKLIGEQYSGDRHYLTTFFYLIPQGNRSVFHKLLSDEVWVFYAGGPIDLYQIFKDGSFKKTVVGPDVAAGQCIQYVVERESWFGAMPQLNVEFSFFGCIMSPGFDFDDWERGEPSFLKQLCPSATNIIEQLT